MGKDLDDYIFCAKYFNNVIRHTSIVIYLINAAMLSANKHTHFMPSMVRDVAAMLVATTHFLIPGGGG